MNVQFKPTTRGFIEARVAEEITTLTASDPFGIDDPCPFNRNGHDPHASCGTVVCVHCAKIFWG
jgi:hypothetical protein